MSLAKLVVFTLLCAIAAGARQPISLQRRVHVNTLITEPGSAEVEWDNVFSSNGDYVMPSLIKYTPEGSNIIWGRTEYSIGFDTVNSALRFDQRINHFSDRVTLAATSVLRDGKIFDFAVAPSASFFLRGDRGARLGATAIARWDWGRNSLGTTFGWTAATHSSPTNPSGIVDWSTGYGRRLAAGGAWGHLTPHTNLQVEKASGVTRQISVFEGIEYQITGRVALDFSGQHYGLGSGAVDHQAVVALTVHFGKLTD